MPEYAKSGDKGAEQIVRWGRAYCEWVTTCFDRAEKLKPCPTGAKGACCKHCHMGPCRFVQSSEEKVEKGVCGATLATVASRNFLRMTVAGAAAHTEHAKEMAFTLLGVAKGEIKDFGIADTGKLSDIAKTLDIKAEGRETKDIAHDVAETLINEFGRQRGSLCYLKKTPEKTRERWENLGIAPHGIDREIVDAIYRTNVGVDHDPDSLLLSALRVSLVDGWGSSMIASDIGDVLFGVPQPVQSEAGIGIFREDKVNLIVIGHELTLSKALIDMASEPEMIVYARSKGADGITIGDIFGLRHGIPMPGGFTNQELCIMTGLIDAIAVDAQGIMPSIVDIAQTFHTKIITTSRKAKLPGALHIQYDAGRAREIAGEILRLAIDNFPNRSGLGEKVSEKFPVISGFSQGYLGNKLRRLNDALSEGRIKGIVSVIGSDNPRVQASGIHKYVIRELIKDDVLIFTTECASSACAVSGLLDPETALGEASPGLRSACEEIGIPPIIPLGSGIDNSRILAILSAMADEGGLSDDIGGMPAVVIAPEWMSEKDIASGCFFAASGIPVIFGGTSPVEASEEVARIMNETWFERFKGSIYFEPDATRLLDMANDYIEKAREALNLRKYEYGNIATG